MFDLTPRETLGLIGWSCLAVTTLIIVFSVTKSPYEIIESFVNWVKSTKKRKRGKSDKGRHHIEEVPGGSDGKDDPQVADHSSDDGTHQDGQKEAA